jgi:uncharacterized membrane protein
MRGLYSSAVMAFVFGLALESLLPIISTFLRIKATHLGSAVMVFA